MKPELRKTAKVIFLKTIQLPVEERSGYVARACAEDPSLKSEVEALLAFYNKRRLWSLDRKKEAKKTLRAKDR